MPNRNKLVKFNIDNILADNVVKNITDDCHYKKAFKMYIHIMQRNKYNNYYKAYEYLLKHNENYGWDMFYIICFRDEYITNYKKLMTEYNHNLKKKVHHE